jgi:hypothetical protein
MSSTIRVLIPLDSQEEQTFGLALAYAEQIAKARHATDVILLTHTKGQLDSTSLSRFLGPTASRALVGGKTARLSWGGALRSETTNTLRHKSVNGIVIAYYANETLLDFVDGLRGVAGAVAVPWLAGEADGWAARWSAVVHGQEKTSPAVLIKDPVVVRALKSLTTVINLTTGLGHPRDKQTANEILRILRAKGHADPSGTIKSWAIQNGWTPKAGSDLEAMSRKIWALKAKPSLAGFHDPGGRYARWTADA